MKKTILATIYSAFAHWSIGEDFCCAQGCSLCCTRNVTIITLEGMNILDFYKANNDLHQLTEILSTPDHSPAPLQTTNEYIADCLAGREGEQQLADSSSCCPFLQNDICTIYPVRPFSCRCFVSQDPCRRHNAATVPNSYLAASMVTMQIIEHLGQFDHWGNMTDVLSTLAGLGTSNEPASIHLDPTAVQRARLRTRRAKPIPGFFFPEEDMHIITPLLEAIFSTKIEGRTIEQILNGRGNTSLQ
jgi:Fe-S-cluster containining protein